MFQGFYVGWKRGTLLAIILFLLYCIDIYIQVWYLRVQKANMPTGYTHDFHFKNLISWTESFGACCVCPSNLQICLLTSSNHVITERESCYRERGRERELLTTIGALTLQNDNLRSELPELNTMRNFAHEHKSLETICNLEILFYFIFFESIWHKNYLQRPKINLVQIIWDEPAATLLGWSFMLDYQSATSTSYHRFTMYTWIHPF